MSNSGGHSASQLPTLSSPLPLPTALVPSATVNSARDSSTSPRSDIDIDRVDEEEVESTMKGTPAALPLLHFEGITPEHDFTDYHSIAGITNGVDTNDVAGWAHSQLRLSNIIQSTFSGGTNNFHGLLSVRAEAEFSVAQNVFAEGSSLAGLLGSHFLGFAQNAIDLPQITQNVETNFSAAEEAPYPEWMFRIGEREVSTARRETASTFSCPSGFVQRQQSGTKPTP